MSKKIEIDCAANCELRCVIRLRCNKVDNKTNQRVKELTSVLFYFFKLVHDIYIFCLLTKLDWEQFLSCFDSWSVFNEALFDDPRSRRWHRHWGLQYNKHRAVQYKQKCNTSKEPCFITYRLSQQTNTVVVLKCVLKGGWVFKKQDIWWLFHHFCSLVLWLFLVGVKLTKNCLRRSTGTPVKKSDSTNKSTRQ